MKKVLMSIHPQWCKKIFSGEKTIEVRKSRPSIPTPFTVYVYCTKWKSYLYKNPNDGELFLDRNGGYRGGDYEDRFLTGKVIGSFVCDQVFEIPCETTQPHWLKEGTRLTDEQYMKYLGNKNGYGWHISDLKIYDKPKELSEFYTLGNCEKYDFCNQCKNFHRGQGWLDGSYCDEDGCLDNTRIPVTRAPQSWCYVEE